MKLGYGYTIEEQLTNTTTGGIQIDVFPPLAKSVKFTNKHQPVVLSKSAQDLGLSAGDKLTMIPSIWETPKTLDQIVKRISCNPVLRMKEQDKFTISVFFGGQELRFFVRKSSRVESIKRVVQEKMGIKSDDLIFRWDCMRLTSGTLEDYGIGEGDEIEVWIEQRGGGYIPLEDGRMGIAAGGKIEQKIYQDTNSPLEYDDENVQRVFIHTVTTAAWEAITGVVAPITPITPSLYKAYNYPWFSIYDEHIPSVQPTGLFNAVQSIGQIDHSAYEGGVNNLIDPRNPPKCTHHADTTSVGVTRPCGHALCAPCIAASALDDAKCAVCDEHVVKFVGFDKPIPKLSIGGGSDPGWWTEEQSIGGVEAGSSGVVTLWLQEDAISPLHGAALPSVPPPYGV